MIDHYVSILFLIGPFVWRLVLFLQTRTPDAHAKHGSEKP